MPRDSWGTPLRDVLSDVVFRLDVGEINRTFRAFAISHNEPYRSPYDNIRAKLDRSIQPHRVETWKKFFDTLGLLYVSAETLHLTPFGHHFMEMEENTLAFVRKSNYQIAQAVVKVLGRYQLLNPTTTNREYPPNCDVLPFRSIWHAMLMLDNRLHHEELNRVLLRVMRQSDLAAAIERIRQARRQATYNPDDEAGAEALLGARIYSDTEQATRRMTPWFSVAGFGGLLIDREAENGYRGIKSEYRELIENELSREVVFRDFGSDEQAWFAYLGGIESESTTVTTSQADTELRNRAIECCRKYGATRFILFSGVAGTGKTRMAGLVADRLSEGDATRRFETQFHESYSYEDFVEGLSPTPQGGFVPSRRILRLANERAKELAVSDPQAQVVLIIEEFSRANLANVLGELFTYIEHRNRRFRYPLSGDEDSISPNLVIIGTMNPLDRSVVEMDDALIRRTRQLRFSYDEGALREMLQANGLGVAVIDLLANAVRPLSTDLPFGHGVFADVTNEEELHYLWSEQLQQYFIKPSGQKHPTYEAFIQSYPWIDRDYRVAEPPRGLSQNAQDDVTDSAQDAGESS